MQHLRSHISRINMFLPGERGSVPGSTLDPTLWILKYDCYMLLKELVHLLHSAAEAIHGPRERRV